MRAPIIRLGLVLIVVLLSPALVRAEQAGTVSRVQGLVTLGEKPGARNVSAGDQVQTGDVVATAPGARVLIILVDGTEVTLSGDTRFAVSELDAASGKGRFDMTGGAFRMVTGLLEKSVSRDFTVNTPLATLGIRGTDFWAGYLEKDGFYVYLASGHGVVVENQAGREVMNRPGDGIAVFSRTVAPTTPRPWGRENIRRAMKTVSFD
jgi:hypothetical protein